MSSIGFRLKEERSRLSLSQDEFARLAGVLRRAQGLYERDQRSPDANYLAALAGHGVDVQYVLTGRHTLELEPALSAYGDAWEVLDRILQDNNKNMPADKKRQAAEVLYEAVRAGDGNVQTLATMLIKAA